jgi:hypothetical protein
MRLRGVGQQARENQKRGGAVFHGRLAWRNFENSDFGVSVVFVLAMEVQIVSPRVLGGKRNSGFRARCEIERLFHSVDVERAGVQAGDRKHNAVTFSRAENSRLGGALQAGLCNIDAEGSRLRIANAFNRKEMFRQNIKANEHYSSARQKCNLSESRLMISNASGTRRSELFHAIGLPSDHLARLPRF